MVLSGVGENGLAKAAVATRSKCSGSSSTTGRPFPSAARRAGENNPDCFAIQHLPSLVLRMSTCAMQNLADQMVLDLSLHQRSVPKTLS